MKLNSIVNSNASAPRKKVTIVLDNHLAHKTNDVSNLAHQLGFELLFQPPYTPEINSIESLWSVVKRDIKKDLLKHRDTELSTEGFKQLI
jgi:transposase